MRLLICLLLLVVLSAPALADDWDGDQVIHKRHTKDKDGAKPAKGKKGEKAEDTDAQPLGMYFGNGDEFLENGAPAQPTLPAEQTGQHGNDPAAGDAPADPEQHVSAILGPHHKPPQFVETADAPGPVAAPELSESTEQESTEDAPAPAADDTVASLSDEFADNGDDAVEADTEQVEATAAIEESEAGAAEESEAAPADEVGSEADNESVQTEDSNDVDSAEHVAVESDEPSTADEEAGDSEDLHEDETLTPPAGLSHYSTYPQVQGVGKSKKSTKQQSSDEDEAAEDHHHHDHDSNDEDVKPKRRGGIKMYDPDTW